MQEINIFAIIIASFLTLLTILFVYTVIYILVIRPKKLQGRVDVIPEEKSSQNEEKTAKKRKPKKGDYAYCELNEIIGYDIIQIKDLSEEINQHKSENPQTQLQTFANAEGTGMQTIHLQTTGSEGTTVDDDDVPTDEQIKKQKEKEEIIRQQEEERNKKLKEEQEYKKQEIERQRREAERQSVFYSSENEPEYDRDIQEQLMHYNIINGKDVWAETHNEDDKENNNFVDSVANELRKKEEEQNREDFKNYLLSQNVDDSTQEDPQEILYAIRQNVNTEFNNIGSNLFD